MAVTLELADLTPFAPGIDPDKAEIMIADAIALAARPAPCILGDELSDSDIAAVKAILRGAILRWNDQGTGEQAQLTAGIFGYNPKGNQRVSMLFPTEIQELAAICGNTVTDRRKAYMVDTLPPEGFYEEGS